MPNKCKKCTVDCVALVQATHEAITRTAINKLRLKVKKGGRIQLDLRQAVRKHPAGTVLPLHGPLEDYLANDAVIEVRLLVQVNECPDAAREQTVFLLRHLALLELRHLSQLVHGLATQVPIGG